MTRGRTREKREGLPVHASVGDRIHIEGKGAGMRGRVGEVIEVRGPEGGPPYLVRFSDGHESLIYPGPDAVVETAAPE
nr:DUF1918 domain-containing protein [Nocardiopsis dassonvillei]